MILESVFNLFSSAVKLIFGWIDIPDLPASVDSVIDSLFEYVSSGIGFLAIFLDMDFVLLLLPFVLVVSNFEKVYKLTMYVLRKIPFLGID